MRVPDGPAIDPALALQLFETMLRIRLFEEAVARDFAANHIPGFTHLSIGQEAVAAGVVAALRPDDYVSSTHRGHGHAVAKGLPVGPLMAEIWGKATGVCKGKGGSMHVADPSRAMLGANGIVGGGFPLAVGAALTSRQLGLDRVSVAFFGEGSSNIGAFHESMNLASIWKLPVLFVCENNIYAESTPAGYHMAVPSVADRAPAYAVPAEQVDGMDPLAVYEATQRATARARAGEGPSLVECFTYRYRGHYEGDSQTYKDPAEQQAWEARDPLPRWRAYLADHGLAAGADLDGVAARIQREIDDAVDFARRSPLPDPTALTDDVWASPYVPAAR